MDICYATDDNFCIQTAVSMLSVIEKAEKRPLCFHLLDAGISDEHYGRLSSLAESAGAQIKRYDVCAVLETVRRTGQKSWGDFPTHATWARLFLPELLPEKTKRVLYLDGDVIANGSFAALFEMDLEDCLAAAVEDCVGRSHKQEIGLASETRYVNAGVLLFDLEKWRREYDPCWPEKYLTGPICYPMADQDVINLMFENRCKPLPLRYNYTAWFRALDLPALQRLMQEKQLCRHTQGEMDECRRNAVLIHYNTCSLLVRPWYKNATDPATKQWRHYYRQSDWGGQALQAEPKCLSEGERKDRKLYQVAGRRWFSIIHTIKRELLLWKRKK